MGQRCKRVEGATAGPASRPTGHDTTGSTAPMTAPTAPPVNTGRVEGWPMPCLPIALTSSIESSTSVGSSGCCRAIILSLIDGEAFAQSADAAPDIRLDVGVAVLTLVAQRLEHVGDHVAEIGRAHV